MMKYFLTLLFSSFLLAESYHVTVPGEGFFVVSNPYENHREIWINSIIGCYSPFKIPFTNQILLYAPKKGTYQLLDTKPQITKPFQHVNNIVKKDSIYRYSITDSKIKNNFFYRIIEPQKCFVDSFKIGQLRSNYNSNLVIHGYCYSSDGTKIIVNNWQNGLDTVINRSGDFIIKIPIQNSASRNMVFTISVDNMIGLRHYELDIDYEAKLDSIEVDHYYFKYPRTLTLSNVNAAAKLYYFKNDSLQMVSNDQITGGVTTTNLYVVKDYDTKFLEIRKSELLQLPIEADLIVLMHENFQKDIVISRLKDFLLQKYPNYRKQVVAFTQDIYDRYSFGNKSASALKKYLHEVKPQQVVLIGDANVYEDDKKNLIPTFYYYQSWHNTRVASDYIYTYETDCMKPEFEISRLPVTFFPELLEYLSKYNIVDKKENNCLILDEDNYLAEINSDNPEWFIRERNESINKTDSLIIRKINITKPKQIFHSGHGALSGWRLNCSLNIKDFVKLDDGIAFDLVDVSCWTGDFAHPEEDSFTEKLLKLERKGARNVVCSSGYMSRIGQVKLTSKLISSKNHTSQLIAMRKKNQLTIDDLHVVNRLGI